MPDSNLDENRINKRESWRFTEGVNDVMYKMREAAQGDCKRGGIYLLWLKYIESQAAM